MPTPKLKPKFQKLNGWELDHGLFEIYWKNDVATRVKIRGSLFRAAHLVILKRKKGE